MSSLVKKKSYKVKYWSCGLDCKGHYHQKKEVAIRCFKLQNPSLYPEALAEKKEKRVQAEKRHRARYKLLGIKRRNPMLKELESIWGEESFKH